MVVIDRPFCAHFFRKQGTITSEIGVWRIWRGITFSKSDLLDFLSEDKSFVRLNFDSMDE